MSDPVLSHGDEGPAVTELQRLLSAAGFDPGPHDGSFGPRVEAAVRAFQAARGLDVDGTVGPQTWAALRGSVPVRVRLSPEGARFIAGFEGFSSVLYNDPAGHCTIGYGHLVHHGPCDGSEPAEFRSGISVDRGIALLEADAVSAASAVAAGVSVALNQQQADALISFTFNVGAGNFRDSTLVRLLNEGAYDTVPQQLNRWVWAGGQVMQGLVRRRAAEGSLFRDGTYGNVDSARMPPPPPRVPVDPPPEEVLVGRYRPRPVLRYGAFGDIVRELQQLLQAAGHASGDITGIFDERVRTAVRQFQQSQGLPPDGVVGATTWAALEGSPPPIEARFPPASPEHAGAQIDAWGWEDHAAFQLGFAWWDLEVDGVVGEKTAAAVAKVQAEDGRLSPHFHMDEFRSHHNGRVRVHRELIRALERTREKFGAPIGVISGYRDPSHPLSVQSPRSQHVFGCAVDPDPYLPPHVVVGSGFSGIGMSEIVDPGKVSHGDVRHVSPYTPDAGSPQDPSEFPDNFAPWEEIGA